MVMIDVCQVPRAASKSPRSAKLTDITVARSILSGRTVLFYFGDTEDRVKTSEGSLRVHLARHRSRSERV